MPPRHFEIHALIMCKHIFHTAVNRWQPYILLGFLFNWRIIVTIYMYEGLIKTAAVTNSHSHFPTPTLHTQTCMCARTYMHARIYLKNWNKISNINSLIITSTIYQNYYSKEERVLCLLYHIHVRAQNPTGKNQLHLQTDIFTLIIITLPSRSD